MSSSMALDGPVVPPPPGTVSNFDNPENQNDLAWGVFATCAAVSTISLFLRAYSRVFLQKKIALEEVLILVAYGNFWGAIWANVSILREPGYMIHSWNVRLAEMIPMTYYILIFGICYSVVLPCLKITILVEWCRMFVPKGNRTKNFFWLGCVAVIFVQATANVAIIVALNLQCRPYVAIWDITVPGRRCFDLFKVQVSSASIHLISDIAILLLPQHVIWTLQMTWQKRLGISFVFGLGLLACISAALRLATTVAYGTSPDPLYKIGDLLFWATAEMACGFFIACVPCLPRLLRDSKGLRRLWHWLGLKSNKSAIKPAKATGAGGTYACTATATVSSKAYYKLDEDGVPMSDLNGTESTEQLHHHSDRMDPSGITRTTHITVTQDARSTGEHGRIDGAVGFEDI